MAEIVRAGILSVDHGQVEAAQALGMSRPTMRRIVLPQAMRVIIPPTGNETISMLKTSSLASVITVTELLYAVQLIYSANFKTIPLLIVACIWYLIVTSILTVGQYYIERHYARGSARELPPTPWQRLRRKLFTFPRAARCPRSSRRDGTDERPGPVRPPGRRTAPPAGHPGPPMVLAEGVHKRFGRLQVLRGIDLGSPGRR